MNIAQVLAQAFAMPLVNPSFPRPPYRFYNREYIIISYRTDPAALAAVVPEPLLVAEPIVKYEFIRMPDSTGFGDYTESGQVIPVTYQGESGGYVHSMYLDDDAPIAGGRELWGFPKKLASPKIVHEGDVVVGTLHYGSQLVASGTIGYKHKAVDTDGVAKALQAAATSSRSSPTWTPRRAFWNWCATGLKTSRSRAPGPRPPRFSCSSMRLRMWPGCPCSKWSQPCTASPTSRWAWVRWCMTT